MRSIVFLFLVLVVGISCSKDDDNIHKTKEITMNLSSNLPYQYYLGTFAEEDEIEITTQALHFEISELMRNQNTGNSYYNYKPQLDFVGEDYVEIISEKTIDEESGKKEIITVKLTFKVL